MEPAIFDRSFHSPERVSRIGTGSIGGKARGLLGAVELVEELNAGSDLHGMELDIPGSVVIGTDYFDEFMDLNDLHGPAGCGMPDERLAHLFQRGSLPVNLLGDLRSIATDVRSPLAIRSSSMLEDALEHPFAGVYSTVMIPNNQPDIDSRLASLCDAVKLVYASTYFSQARNYMRSISRKPSEEKMAVILQQVVGGRHSDRFYPDISGVGRSLNFYPFGHGEREDGIVELALGLGKTIVDGAGGWCFCPEHPKSPPPFKSVGDMMKQTQNSFWAVNMAPTSKYSATREETHLLRCTLADAEYDNILRHVASTYSAASDRVVPGTGPDGPRIVNFAPILQMSEPPLHRVVQKLMKACESTAGGAVEIEFAVDLNSLNSPRVHLLQVRRMQVAGSTVELSAEELSASDAVVSSRRVLGDGERNDLVDIVYIRPDRFKPSDSTRAAMEIEVADGQLASKDSRYLLIGFGRFGTTDPFRGLPVAWGQISCARAIVEVYKTGMETEFSQGSHFFHNMTGFGVYYFSVTPGEGYHVDWEWLEGLPVVWEGQFVRHVRAPSPMRMKVDGNSTSGVIRR